MTSITWIPLMLDLIITKKIVGVRRGIVTLKNNWIGPAPSICAACGMAAVFCGVTNCQITSILIAYEMFGFKGVSFYLIAVSISYAASGYYGLNKDQTNVYTKYKAKYVNRHTRFWYRVKCEGRVYTGIISYGIPHGHDRKISGHLRKSDVIY